MTSPSHSAPAPLRLAYLVSQYPAINHAFMLREVRRLREIGFDVQVVSIREPDRADSGLTWEEREEKQATFYVKSQSALTVLAAHLRSLFKLPSGYLRGIRQALRIGGIRPSGVVRAAFYFAEAVVAGEWMVRRGVMHVHTHYASNIALIASSIFPITMSAAFHGPDEFKDPAGFRLAEKVAASRFVCAISDYGRSQTMFSCDYAQWSKLEVTRLGVDTSALLPVPFREHPDTFELLCAGRLAPVKAQHVLLDSMAVLVQQGYPVRLNIAGDGPDRLSLEQHAKAAGLHDAVVFHGFLNQEALRKLYETTDIFVLPSFAEGVPVVLMEAMALGIPCVSTWVNGIPELIRNGIDGLTVAPGDAAALADAAARCVDNPEFRRNLSLAARERAIELADLNRNVEHLADIFVRYLGTEDVSAIPSQECAKQSQAADSAVELRS